MEQDPKNPDIVNLLKKLKEAGGGYPQDMLELRRQGYLKQVGEVAGGAGLALSMRETLKSGKGAGSSAAAGKVVELVLVAAIVVEAAAVTYFYRDKIIDFFRSDSNEPRVEEVSHPPVLPSLIPETGWVPTLVETPTFIVTDTPVSTPSPQLAAQPTEQDQQENSSADNGSEARPAIEGTDNEAGGGSGSQPPALTPNPNDDNNDDGNNNGNNGNHYGQTPKPERTKEPGNENSNNNQDNQDNRDRDKD